MPKGQAALEFMTTYGWALIVVLVMIMAIVYFDIFDTDNFIQDSCSVSGELQCREFTVNPQIVKIQLKNNFGKDITINDVTCQDEAGNSATTSPGLPVSPGSTIDVTCDFGSALFNPGDKQKFTFEIEYRRTTGTVDHIVTGDLISTVSS